MVMRPTAGTSDGARLARSELAHSRTDYRGETGDEQQGEDGSAFH